MGKSLEKIEIPNKVLFNVVEVARIFGVTRQTIYDWIKYDRLNCSRTPGGRIRINRNSLLKICEDRKIL